MATNKIALVTGGSRGLGKNMALAIARKGIDVVITYNSKKDEAIAVVAEIEKTGRKAAALQLNTGDVKSFDTFFSSLTIILSDHFSTDHFDFLINNLQTFFPILFIVSNQKSHHFIIALHARGLFICN